MRNLASDQHTKGTQTYVNGGYMNLTCNYDITWHYDVAKDQVTVTNADVKLVREDPEKYADMTNGFWDSFAFVKPNATIPHEDGTYTWADEPNHSDLPGVNGDYLWSMVKNDAMAFFSQDSNRTASPYVIKYSTQTPYIATKNADGTYTLMLTLDRYRDGITAIGQPNRPVWTVDSKKVTISIPQRKTTEADYHYNQAENRYYESRIIFSIIFWLSLSANSLTMCT